jgi:hypothetical protein
MKLTIAAAALLAETAVTGTSHNSNSNHHHSALLGHYPSRHEGRELSSYATERSSSFTPGRQLEAFSTFASSNSNMNKGEHAMDIAKTLLKNKKQQAGATSSSRGQKLHEWVAVGRKHQLVNLVAKEETLQECDPYKGSTYDSTADVGILSCGQGRYCLESSLVSTAEAPIESSLGGVCVDMPAESTVGLLDSMMLSTDRQGSRNLQANDTTIIDDMYEICYGNFTSPGVSCDCQGVDVAGYTGSLSCAAEEICRDLSNFCGYNTTFCYSVTYSLSASAPYTGEFLTQYQFTLPNPFEYQYGVAYNGSPEAESCTISFDGTQCSSCEFTEVLYDGETEPLDCIAFDCTNTNLDLEATLCEYSIVDLLIADYLVYGALPCPDGCNLCGEGGYMTDTYNNVTFPTGESYNCRAVEVAALGGYFAGVEPDLCTLLPPLVEVSCGCTGGVNGTAPPTVLSTSGPTVEALSTPTATPVTSPVSLPTSAPLGTPTAASTASSKSGLGMAAAAAVGWVVQQVMAA